MTVDGAMDREMVISVKDGETPLNVDVTRITMAMNNILENAAAFTPKNATISLDAWRHDQNEVRISVTDTGIGLEEKHLSKIFDDFYQVEDHMTRHHGGLGIGLSITRALVEAHGGRVWASSPGLNQGMTITIALPAANDAS
jgi:signal transduction histidine kinase